MYSREQGSEEESQGVAHLEETNRLAHRRLQVERLDVLPVLFEERNEEVDAYHFHKELAIDSLCRGEDGYALNMTLARTWSSFIWMWPTATPRHRTFLSWNLMVERTSVSLFARSSACDTGVGNFPATDSKALNMSE